MRDELFSNTKLTFSGHESFHCRHLWLKKGFDFIYHGNTFADQDAVITLGVGKNMVSSIKFWMKAFYIIDSYERLTDFGCFIFGDDCFDPFLEDEQSLWLLHYSLIKNNYSSIYGLVFSQVRKEKPLFSKENFIDFAKRLSSSMSEKTLADDFDVFKKMYLNNFEDKKGEEDSSLGLLSDLNVLKQFQKGIFFIDQNALALISSHVFLFSILDNYPDDNSISLSSLENDQFGPGNIFALNREIIISKIEALVLEFSWITYSDQAGIKELQFKKKPTDLFSVFNQKDEY